MGRKLCLVILMMLVMVPVVSSKVLYVNRDNRSDVHDGSSWTTAFRTVTSALDSAAGGDEVWVAKGVYVERIEPPGGIRLYGGFSGMETIRHQRDWKANATVLDGGLPAVGSVVVCRHKDIVVDGFTLRYGYYDGIDMLPESSAVIANCIITENGIGVSTSVKSTAVLINNVIKGNYSGVESGTYVIETPWPQLTLINNTITENDTFGAYLGRGHATLLNNTICANGSYGLSVGTEGIIANNLIAFNGGYGFRDRRGIITVYSHNNVYGNRGGEYQNYTPPAGQGNISEDPKIASLYRDPHIQPDSPCIDAGDDTRVVEKKDIDGQRRIQGEHVDIGSDESDGTIWVFPSVTWHVSESGNDANDGKTWATAKRTVESALDNVRGTDEVWVARGVYTLAEKLRVPAYTSLYGGFAGTETHREQRDWKANATVLNGTGGHPFVSCSRPDIIIDGLTLHRVRVSCGSNTVLANSTITRCNDWGVLAGGMAIVKNNTIADNGTGLAVGNGTPTISNNIISGNRRDGGVFMYTEEGDGGTATFLNNTISGNSAGVTVHTGTAILINNTITDNNNHGVDGYRNMAEMSNNIVAFNGGYGVSAFSIPVFSHNNVYGNAVNYSGLTPPADQGNLTVDPLFLDRANGNFHLQPGSLCIDVGDDSAVPPGSTDLDGKPRILGEHVDMGAYEWDPSAPIPITLEDVRRALTVAAGMRVASAEDLSRLNDETDDPALTVAVAIRLVRKAAGLEAKP